MQSRYLSAQKLSGASVVRVSTMQSEACARRAARASGAPAARAEGNCFLTLVVDHVDHVLAADTLSLIHI